MSRSASLFPSSPSDTDRACPWCKCQLVLKGNTLVLWHFIHTPSHPPIPWCQSNWRVAAFSPPIGHEVTLKTEYRLHFQRRSTWWMMQTVYQCEGQVHSQAWDVLICQWGLNHLCVAVTFRDAMCVIIPLWQKGWRHVCMQEKCFEGWMFPLTVRSSWAVNCYEKWFRWIVSG